MKDLTKEVNAIVSLYDLYKGRYKIIYRKLTLEFTSGENFVIDRSNAKQSKSFYDYKEAIKYFVKLRNQEDNDIFSNQRLG